MRLRRRPPRIPAAPHATAPRRAPCSCGGGCLGCAARTHALSSESPRLPTVTAFAGPETKNPSPPTAGGAATKPAAPAAPAPCAPKAVPFSKFPKGAGAFGLTRFVGANVVYSGPQITKRRRGGYRIQPVQAALGTAIDSIYIQAGSFTDPTVKTVIAKGGECPSSKSGTRFTISPGGAKRIVQGEQEHCADFKLAFDLSLGSFTRIANRMTRRRFPSPRSATRALRRKTGVDPSQWEATLACLAAKSRDVRDRQLRQHDPRFRSIPPTLRNGCKSRQVLHAGSLPHVGTTAPSAIIKGCGLPTPKKGGRRRP